MTLVGHDEAWRTWRAALAGPRLHHGWILAGKRGLGKAGFALAAARELVTERGVPQPPGEHPDILILNPPPKDDKEEAKKQEGKPYDTRRGINIGQIRAMRRRLETRPTLGSRRVVIIDPADTLEPEAKNALLKSLEEPPAGTYFLLIVHRLGGLLPTIRSRCRVLPFAPLTASELDAILESGAPDSDAATRAAAVAAAGGSPGAALEFVELDLGKVHRAMQAIAERGDRDLALRGNLADAMGQRPDRKRQLAAIELARAVVAARMAATPREAIPALTQAHAELLRLAAQAPTYNYDAGFLVMEIGGLLASVGAPTAPAHG